MLQKFLSQIGWITRVVESDNEKFVVTAELDIQWDLSREEPRMDSYTVHRVFVDNVDMTDNFDEYYDGLITWDEIERLKIVLIEELKRYED